MDVESAIRAFASAGHDLPRDVMRWALDNWDEAAPGLLGVLERFADGTDRSEEAANALFFILHLAGERRETRAFAPLCRLAKEADVLETVMGDGVTTTLKRILIGTYDGDLDTLKGMIEAAEADEYVRSGALQVLAYLTATGRVAREETEAYLLRLYDSMEPQHENFVWSGWVLAIALLGLETLSGIVRQAFARGLIDPMVMRYDDFRRDLARTLADPERMAGFRHDRHRAARGRDRRAVRLVRLLGRVQAGSGAARPGRGHGPRPFRGSPTLDQPVQGCRPERSLSVWQRQEVQEVLLALSVCHSRQVLAAAVLLGGIH